MAVSKKAKTTVEFPSSNIQLDNTFIWQIWLLKTATRGKSAVKLLYSWIIPSDSNQVGWQSAVEECSCPILNSLNKSVKMDLIRADYYGSGKNILQYIQGLLQGAFLSEVETDETSSIPHDFLNLSLGENIDNIESSFVIRPEIMLPIDHLLVPWASKATPNPADYCVFVNQLFFIQKINLLSFDDFDLNLSQSKEVINILGIQINKATGFNILKESAPRLGNIEWYRMPVSDGNLKPLISYGAIKDNSTAKGVRVYFEPLPQGSKSILIRCRIINGEEISLDQIKDLEWSDSKMEIEFCSQQPVCEIEVTVWEKGSDGLATIIFEQSNHCIRSMHTQMAIAGSQINSGKINLLNKLAKKEEDKKTELAQYNRSTAAGTSEIGGYNDDPWVSSSRSVIAFMKKLYPEKSKGHFFLNGWDENTGQSGQLSFIEWIFKVISGDQRGGLIFLDPYFDKDAIEIFANARTTNTQYRIVTCTQHREKEEFATVDAETPSESIAAASTGLTKSAQGIQHACELMKPLINNLELYINDLVSPERGKQQLFHDRYLLLLDKDGQVEQGFHLSNSLQGATRKAPLLVTPIPDDILPSVYDYIETLINPGTDTASSKKIEIVQIYPISKVEEAPVAPINAESETIAEPIEKLKDIPDAGFFFSKLLADDSFENVTKASVYKRLKEVGLIGQDNDSFLLYMLSASQLEKFGVTLTELNQSGFNSVMAAFGECQARGQMHRHEQRSGDMITLPSYDASAELVGQIQKYPEIAEKLLVFIRTFRDTAHFSGYRVRIYQIFNEPTFEGALQSTIDQLNHIGGDFFGVKYKYYYACKLFVKCFPDQAVSLLEELLEDAEKGGWNEASSNMRAKMLLISTLAHRTLRYYNQYDIQLQVVLLKSSDFRIRASACAALVQGLSYDRKENYEFDEFIKILLSNLSDEEYRLTLSAFLADLSIIRNRQEHDTLVEKSTSVLLKDWVGNEALITRVIAVLSGRLNFNRSYTITTKFLNPLVDAGRTTNKFCFDYWNAVFERKITSQEKYVSGSSETLVDHFSQNTDFELTNTIVYYFSQLTEVEQLQILRHWFALVHPMWGVINKPFAYHSSHNSYDGACERVYWLTTILKILIENELCSPQASIDGNAFLEEFQCEIEKVNRHQQDRSYSQILGLREKYESPGS